MPPPGWRPDPSRRAPTWWPAAPTSTAAAASTTATPRPTTATMATVTWTRSTSAPCAGSPRATDPVRGCRADLENGLFGGGNGNNPNNAGNKSTFVTALVKNNGTSTYAIKGGNADSGGLTTWYSGSLPTQGGYIPMHQEGAIILGIGGDNSNSSAGDFFEGVMTAGYPTDAADNSVQANINSVGYAFPSGTGVTGPIVAGD